MAKKEVWVIVFILLASSAAGAVFVDDTQSDFDLGSYNGSYYNTSAVGVMSYGNASFISQVFSLGFTAVWNSISWSAEIPYGIDLPDNEGNDGADMSDNRLLLHLDEGSGNLIDTSGYAHHGSGSGISYGSTGKFGNAVLFDGDDVITVDVDNYSSISLEGWMKADGSQRARGDIGNEINSSEFDTVNGRELDMIQINGNIYALAYGGAGDDGFLKTMEIVNGVVNEIASLEFDTANGRDADVFLISNEIYGIAYRGQDNDGFLTSVNISSDGQINGIIDSTEYDTGNGREPHVVSLGGDVFAIAYRGGGSDGFLKTFNLNKGQISVIDSLEFDTANGREPSMVLVSGDVYAIAYRGSGDDGFLKTVNVSGDGLINGLIDTFEYDTSNGMEPNMIFISDDMYAIVYRGSVDQGFLKTVNISNDGSIKVIDTFEYDINNSQEPNIVRVSGDIYAIAYRGADDDGFLTTIEIGEDGQIGNVIENYEFDTNDGEDPFIMHLEGDNYAIAYTGVGNDGFLKTIEIVTNRGIVRPGAYGIAINGSSAFGMIGEDFISSSASAGWNHVVLTSDGSIQKLYVNGEETASGNVAGIPENSENLLIGNMFSGVIDEVGLYKRVLSAAEVLHRYKRGILNIDFKVKSCAIVNCSENWNMTLEEPGSLSLDNTSSRTAPDSVSL